MVPCSVQECQLRTLPVPGAVRGAAAAPVGAAPAASEPPGDPAEVQAAAVSAIAAQPVAPARVNLRDRG